MNGIGLMRLCKYLPDMDEFILFTDFSCHENENSDAVARMGFRLGSSLPRWAFDASPRSMVGDYRCVNSWVQDALHPSVKMGNPPKRRLIFFRGSPVS